MTTTLRPPSRHAAARPFRPVPPALLEGGPEPAPRAEAAWGWVLVALPFLLGAALWALIGHVGR